MRATPSRHPLTDGYRLLFATAFRHGEIATLRRAVTRALAKCGLGKQAHDGFLIAINEVASNAVRHGGGAGLLRLWGDGDVLCEVVDRGEGFEPGPYLDLVEPPTSTASGGFGLWIARQTTSGVAIDSGPDGTTVRLTAMRGAKDMAEPP